MSNYELIKSSCLQKNVLWEDPDFPAQQSSVFYFQTPPFNFVWKRAKDIFRKPSFMLDQCETFDVVSGKLGDSWLVSCLGVLYLCKGLFHKVVPPDQRMDSSYAGIFRFRLWWCGQWTEVLVDDRLPTVNGKLAFLRPAYTEQVWPALLEKAYAKLHGSYEALKYGSTLIGLADLMGGASESFSMKSIDDVQMLKVLLRTSSIVTAYHSPNSDDDLRPSELQFRMNYMLCEIQEVETTNESIYLVRLKRPLDPEQTSRTHLVMDEGLWKTIPRSERDRLTDSCDGFWMLYVEFKMLFHRLETLHLDAEASRSETLLADRYKWQVKIHQGEWKRGVSAGGCRNFGEYFHTNPQVQVILNDPTTLLVCLNQHSVTDPKVVGFSIYQIPRSLTETAPEQFFQLAKTAINSQYTNSRQISQRCNLDPGTYLIIPSTFTARLEAQFTLRLFSTKPITMTVLDDSPQMTKAAIIKAPFRIDTDSFFKYQTIFVQMADEHGMVDVFGLQELLDVCLPNDYIKSCVSLETCRHIVLAMDKKGTGKLTLSEFKDLICTLKHLQILFKNHTQEKIGVLRVEKFRDALRDVGFVLPVKVMSLLVFRFMRKDGMLRFGDFVSAVMHLHRAFEIFYTSEERRSDVLQLNLTGWLQNALMF